MPSSASSVLSPGGPLVMDRQEVLTGRQLRVLELSAEGLMRKQVALAMGLSEETVRNHLARMRYRLGAKTTAQAVAIAFRRGLID